MRRLHPRLVARSVSVASVALIAAQAQAGQLISAAGTVDLVDHVNTTAGGTASYLDANFNAKATTDFGVNKIYNQASTIPGSGVSYASSAWAETFTAQGTGMVTVKLNFTIDGSVAYHQTEGMAAANYLVSALKGAWDLTGTDEIAATKAATTTETAFGAQRTFTGLWTVPVNEPSNTYYYGATTADGAYQVNRSINKTGDNVLIQSYLNGPGVFTQNTVLQTPDHLTITSYNPAQNPTVNTIPYANNAAAATAYQNNLTNFPILAQSDLCSSYSATDHYQGCAPGTYDPTTLSLEFTLAAGTVFTIVSSLSSSQLENGTVDFYNTVKLKDIDVVNGTLTSDNSAFQSRSDGTYGFGAAAAADVPEPASWVMMILGFGLIGSTMRRRQAIVRFC